LDHNENRKLSKKERAEKHKLKMERQAEEEMHAALFRIEEFKDKKTRFKVDKNA
jgi:hypothetical protein